MQINTKVRVIVLFRQLISFGLVGVLTLVVDISTTTFTYYVFEIPAIFSSGIGFLSGFVVNFPLNRNKVFKLEAPSKHKLHTQIILFISLSIFNLFATSFAVAYMVDSLSFHIIFAKSSVTILFFFWNFVILRKFIFASKIPSTNQVLEN